MALEVSVVTFRIHLRRRQVASADPRGLCVPSRIYRQLRAATCSATALISDQLEGAGPCGTETQMNVSRLVMQETSHSVCCAPHGERF